MHWALAEFPETREPGVWIGATERSIVQMSTDGERWTRVADLLSTATIGRVVEWPMVELYSGSLRSVPEPGPETNRLWVLDRLVSVGDAELVEEDTYRIGRCLPGLRGTPSAPPPNGSEVMLLGPGVEFVPLSLAARGREIHWRVVAEGEEPNMARARIHAPTCPVAPPLDGTRTSVTGRASRPTDYPLWGDRFIVANGTGEWEGQDGAVWSWVDSWVRESVEPGQAVLDLETGRRSYWDGQRWLSCL